MILYNIKVVKHICPSDGGGVINCKINYFFHSPQQNRLQNLKPNVKNAKNESMIQIEVQ